VLETAALPPATPSMSAPSVSLLPLAAYGLVLGWSVAWPPGPINAEIIRRGLARGFWPACAVGLGASTGDALWALLVVLGAGVLFASAAARLVLAVVSTLLLLVLALLLLRGAARSYAAWRTGVRVAAPRAFDGTRAGFVLGLGLALSSPWNIAFWLAVIGRAEAMAAGLVGGLVVATAVIVGAVAWVVVLATLVVLLRLHSQSGAWEVIAKGATGLLMLYFAITGIARFLAG
jgi:threonine/homoserine/homoserine lactone efflux protein